MNTFVQIGANRGNDDLTLLLEGFKGQDNKLILVEPMKLHNQALNDIYGWVKELHIENIVIDNIEKDEVEFFYHPNDAPHYEIASLSKEHIYVRHTGLPEEGIQSFMIKAMSINSLFRKYELTDIDILFIDAEGLDDAIISSIEFASFNIKKIYFENLHIKNPEIYAYLESKGYKTTRQVGYNGWSSLAEK
jgi:FkbM family methyltransferase